MSNSSILSSYSFILLVSSSVSRISIFSSITGITGVSDGTDSTDSVSAVGSTGSTGGVCFNPLFIVSFIFGTLTLVSFGFGGSGSILMAFLGLITFAYLFSLTLTTVSVYFSKKLSGSLELFCLESFFTSM